MYTSMMMRMRISELVTLWWKTCPDIEEETPTTGSVAHTRTCQSTNNARILGNISGMMTRGIVMPVL